MDGTDEDLYDESEHESIQDEESVESYGDQEVKDHVDDDFISPEQRDNRTEMNKIGMICLCWLCSISLTYFEQLFWRYRA